MRIKEKVNETSLYQKICYKKLSTVTHLWYEVGNNNSIHEIRLEIGVPDTNDMKKISLEVAKCLNKDGGSSLS